MARQPKVKRTKAQEAASRKWAAAGRAKEAKVRASFRAAHHGMAPPRSKAQRQATVKWLASGRAAQAARRQGKPPAPLKKRAAVMPEEMLLPGYTWALGCNDLYPTCAAAAVANHLYARTGLRMSENQVLWLHQAAGGDESGAGIEAVLEYLSALDYGRAADGRPFVLSSFTRTDEDVIVAGLVAGLSTPHGSHAVLTHPEGMVSWGRVMPWEGTAEEAWALEWFW